MRIIALHVRLGTDKEVADCEGMGTMNIACPDHAAFPNPPRTAARFAFFQTRIPSSLPPESHISLSPTRTTRRALPATSYGDHGDSLRRVL